MSSTMLTEEALAARDADSVTDSPSAEASQGFVKDIDSEERRMDEMELVREADSTQLDAYEDCWVLLPTSWLQEWSAYVAGEGPRPGVVRNHELLELDNSPKPGLVKVRDYRAVNCRVYALYAELYGTDCTPAVCRYEVDLYAPSVMGKFKEAALRGPLLEARIAAQEVRKRYEYPPSEPDSDTDVICCCCVTRTCIENMLYAIFTCGRHLTAPPRYTKLQMEDDDEDLDTEEVEGETQNGD
uniref:DUSP domain-containing protein n=1 Tax=Pinguiococcus pyrenoidosus TaxID=172671 RepID=A0A7R9U3S0_9STRA|mmetsp:Transcript_13759/g.51365  ORF Transcript_13759/g.51365 Transcript_13759/m.51365 type:complete len:242 (+) Transcript_13759:58-783(+)|eukprot:scaffold2161_cov244-Pinguiococcus_pyrenoidosus.AAC.19